LRYIKKITYSWYCSASPAAAVVDAADVVGVAAAVGAAAAATAVVAAVALQQFVATFAAMMLLLKNKLHIF